MIGGFAVIIYGGPLPLMLTVSLTQHDGEELLGEPYMLGVFSDSLKASKPVYDLRHVEKIPDTSSEFLSML